MREGLEQDLRKYNKVAKREFEFNQIEHKRRARAHFNAEIDTSISKIFRETVRKATSGQKPSIEAARKVYELQYAKQSLMQQLYRDLAELDNEAYWKEKLEDGYDVYQEGDQLFAIMPNGDNLPVTPGDIIADEQLGLHYNLDPASCNRNVKKLQLIERTKEQLRRLLNIQLVKDAYSRGDLKSANELGGPSGMIKEKGESIGIQAEVVARSFLERTIIDNDMGIQIEEADAEMDGVQKIDMAVVRRLKNGHKLENPKFGEVKIGIQLTTSQSKTHLEIKQNMVNKSQKRLTATGHYTDVILIQIPPYITRQIAKAFKRWQAEKLPGGPDRYLLLETKEQLFKLLVNRLFTAEELDEQWSRIAANEGDDLAMNSLVEPQKDIELSQLYEIPPILAQNIAHVEHAQAAD